MTMNKLWKASILGSAVVAVATLVAACDPFLPANTAAPVVIGAIVVPASSTINRNYNGVVLQPDDGGYACPGGLPYPSASGAWFDATYPGGKGNCGDGSGPTPLACPQSCWPPRAGPAFAPYYLGDNSASYGCAIPLDPRCSGGVHSYATAAAYVISNIPPGVIPASVLGASYKYNQMRVTFNKSMDGSSIQKLLPNTTTGALCDPADGILVTRRGPADTAPVDVTLLMNVCYVPSAGNSNWGASMSVQPRIVPPATSSPGLAASTTYRVTGSVKDQDGNTLAVDASFTTAAVFPEPVP